jgi:FkbM family methyltransferase
MRWLSFLEVAFRTRSDWHGCHFLTLRTADTEYRDAEQSKGAGKSSAVEMPWPARPIGVAMSSPVESSGDRPDAARASGDIRISVKIRGHLDVAFVVDSQLHDPIGRTIVEHGQYPVGATSELMMHLLRPGQTLLDVGAHIGTYALPAAALGCRVLAVEGSARNVELLEAARNANAFDQVTVVHAAASDRAGRLTFTPWGPHGHVTAPVEGAHMPRSEVRAVAIDDLLAELGWEHVDFVKIDIEGWEPQALKGMERLLRRPDAPLVMFESNAAGLEMYHRTTHEVLATLENMGYANYLIDHHELGRLIPVQAADIQPECVMDYLAAKRLPDDLSPWWVKPFTPEELTTRVLLACTDPHQPYRKHAATALQNGPQWMVEQPGVREALRSLRLDADVGVRKAAAWSALLPEPAGRGQALLGRLRRLFGRKAG